MMSRVVPGLVLIAALVTAMPAATQEAGSTFSDCETCPTMVVIPSGSFRMGDLAGTGLQKEQPAHEVTVPHPFSVSTYEITFSEWDACVADGGCTHVPGDENWGRGRRAVGNVSWDDTIQYLDWLSAKTGKRYRLLTESEWEYVTRAGTETLYPWGNELGNGNAVCLSCGVGSVMTIEVGTVPANAFGVYDTIGSRREWVQDCWHPDYQDAPTDGSAWISGDCSRRVMRGGSYYDSARFNRSASRAVSGSNYRNTKIGFRVARDP